MRLPINERFVLSSLISTLPNHGPFQPEFSTAMAAGHLRSFQRARRRSYAERGLRSSSSCQWDLLHLPYDPISYNLSAYEGRMFSYSQQVRFVEAKGDCHYHLLSTMRELGMFEEKDQKRILKLVTDECDGMISQVGGWVARPSGHSRRAAFLPYYCWALQRLMGIRFSYAICRTDNGAADFLMRIGGFSMMKPFPSYYFGGDVQLVGFRIFDPAAPRHEPLIKAAEEQLVKSTSLRLGNLQLSELQPADLQSITHVKPGGGLARRSPEILLAESA